MRKLDANLTQLAELIEDPKWQAYLARSRLRKALAEKLAKPGRPVRFYHPERGDASALAGPDMAGDAPYRLTTFDALGPWGHECFRDLESAIAEALQRGYVARESRP